MMVLDCAPHGWFLLRDGDAYLLDVNCNHGAVDYPFLTALDETELAR
jgi:hypothetical protein